MTRERALQVLMLLVGLLFSAGIIPLVMMLRRPVAPENGGDTMMLSLYVTLGVMLLITVRNPSAHRSLIGFAAWSSFAHAAVMSIMALQGASDRQGLLIGSGVLIIIGTPLLLLVPGKPGARQPVAGRVPAIVSPPPVSQS